MKGVRVRELEMIGAHELDGLCEVLIDCVEGGASVNFMRPMTRDKAERFWRGVGDGLARRDRALIVAEDAAGRIIGTAQAVWALQENQPHRADVAKMLVHRRARRLGVGGALLAAAERAAQAAGRTLLVLDTASADAERLYERGGWQRVGSIPRYALMPDGPYCSTVVFYKDLDNSSRATESRT
jgi:GNAT superfamily N-acetyltransferase